MNKILLFAALALPVFAFAKPDNKAATTSKTKESVAKRSTANTGATQFGTSEVSVQDKAGWIRIEGDAAKALYDALKDKAREGKGEAGPDVLFKKGKSYSCHFSSNDGLYACIISITNVRQGLL